MAVIKNKYDFELLFDVEFGNPNGDPDASNSPRFDAETGTGYVTDVCLKHKIRKYVGDIMRGKPGYDILIRSGMPLNEKLAEAHEAVSHMQRPSYGALDPSEETALARKYICEKYFDVRTFGAVMSTGGDKVACGRVCGPVQINFARSVDPIRAREISVIRDAITKRVKLDRISLATGMATEMGQKFVIPYALYKVEGYVSARMAEKETGFSEEDLELLWKALVNMFEDDHSADRGKMEVKALYVFKHDCDCGNAPSASLFRKISVSKKEGVTIPMSYDDYVVDIDRNMPSGVEFLEMYNLTG